MRLAARGMLRRGFCVSAAVTDIPTMPEGAQIALLRQVKNLWGKQGKMC